MRKEHSKNQRNWKKLLLVPGFLLGTAAVLTIWNLSFVYESVDSSLQSNLLRAQRVQALEKQQVSELLSSNAAVQTDVGEPVLLEIPQLSVNATIEPVGQNSSGEMARPRVWSNVAWYEPGPRPGQPGNSVLAGHLNDLRLAPSTFWDLNKLRPGDVVYVTDDKQVKRSFRVTKVASYDVDQAPLSEIFGASTVSRLNLVTCDGRWDRLRNEYGNRLVVYTELIAGAQ